nr:type VI secretion system protein TssA [uncultured Moellerella sp.]
MTIKTRFNWSEKLLTPLDEASMASQITEASEDWEYIDGEMIKFGSLSHAQLNIEEIQSRALNLFATQTKDFRLFVHLLRTLQHSADPAELVLASELLALFINQFWTISYPSNMRLKLRLAQQVIKRFESATDSFCRRANSLQRDEILGHFAYLAKSLHSSAPQLSKDIDGLSQGYNRIENNQDPAASTNLMSASAPVAEENSRPNLAPAPVVAEVPSVEINSSNDRGWKQTLLNVAEILCERHPNSAIGYQLRRHAIWQGIQSIPMATPEGKTPLAAVSSDRVMDYRALLLQSDTKLLNQIEQSLTLAPYWFDGHMLAAQAANQQGFHQVADAIRHELSLFLKRLPALAELYFADMTPFISAETAEWLAQYESCSEKSTQAALVESTHDQQRIIDCFEQQGLNAALLLLEAELASASQERDRFYLQLLGANLFEQANMHSIAQAQYQQLHQLASQYSLSDWEPSLLLQLAEKSERVPEIDLIRNNRR